MKKEQEKEFNQKKDELMEVSNLLPEVKYKVEFYKDVMKAESNLIKVLENSIKEKSTSELEKARYTIEVIEKKNSLVAKTKVFENYLKRKQDYEKFLDDMSREVDENFEQVIEKASEITYNIRLQTNLKSYFEKVENKVDTHSMKERVEFYMYVKQEILNSEKHKTKKVSTPSEPKDKKGKIIEMSK